MVRRRAPISPAKSSRRITRIVQASRAATATPAQMATTKVVRLLKSPSMAMPRLVWRTLPVGSPCRLRTEAVESR